MDTLTIKLRTIKESQLQAVKLMPRSDYSVEPTLSKI